MDRGQGLGGRGCLGSDEALEESANDQFLMTELSIVILAIVKQSKCLDI